MANKCSRFPVDKLIVGDIEVQSDSSCRVTSNNILFVTDNWILGLYRRLHFIDKKCVIRDAKSRKITTFKLVGDQTPFAEYYADAFSEFLARSGKTKIKGGLTRREIDQIQKIHLNITQSKAELTV